MKYINCEHLLWTSVHVSLWVTYWVHRIRVGHGSTRTDPWLMWPIWKVTHLSWPTDPSIHCLLCHARFKVDQLLNGFSGPGEEWVSVCLCVWTITFEINDIWTIYLVHFDPLYVKFKGQGHKQNFAVTRAQQLLIWTAIAWTENK